MDLKGLLERLEDAYYSFLDSLMARGIPVDKIVGPLESHGINTFYLFSGITIAVLLALGWWLYSAFMVPTHIFYFTDALGNPLVGVKATFVVDGVKKVFTTDSEGKIVIEGREVLFRGAIYEGYQFSNVRKEEEATYIILEPKRYFTKVKIVDQDGAPLDAHLTISVDGTEVFSDSGSNFEVCFTEVKAKGCILASPGSKITFEASKEGYGTKTVSYSLTDLPSLITLTLVKASSKKEEVVEAQRFATVTIKASYDEIDKPVDGMIYIAPVNSPGTGTPVRIRAGASTPLRLAIGTYRVVSAQVLLNNHYVATEVVDGSPFTVLQDTQIVDLVLKTPKELFSVSFTVRDANTGELIDGARIVLSFNGQKIERTAKNGKATIELSGEGCGTYTVTAKNYESNSGKICTGESKTVSLVRVIKRGNVKVVVYSPTNDPLPNATVYLVDDSGNDTGFKGTTDVKGEVTFKGVPVGSYTAVAEFLSTVASSDEFNVTENNTVVVPIYFAQQKVSLTILVERGGKPLPGAIVTVYDERGYKLGNGMTGLDGTFQIDVPPLIGVVVDVNYGGVIIEAGPYAVPSVDSYTLEVNFPEKTKDYVKFIGVKSTDGKKVGSLQPGKDYILNFEVGFRGMVDFNLFIPDGMSVVWTDPEGEIGEHGATITLSSRAFSVKNVRIKIHVDLGYPDNIATFTYAMEGNSYSVVLPVGKEFTCGDYLCYIFSIFDENGVEVGPGETLNALNSYTAKVAFRGSLEDEVNVMLVMQHSNGREEILGTYSGKVEKGKVYKIEANFYPLDEESLDFYLIAKAGKRVIEKDYLGTWSVYTPHFGPLFMDLNVIDAETNIVYPPGWFVRKRKLKVEYRVYDMDLNDPETPVSLTVYCDGKLLASTSGQTKGILSFYEDCMELNIVASAVGYEDAFDGRKAITAEDINVYPVDPYVILEKGKKVKRTLVIKGPLPGHISLSARYQNGCGLRVEINGKTAVFNWNSDACLGMGRREEIDALVLLDGIPLGKTYVPFYIQYGLFAKCLYIKRKVEGPSAGNGKFVITDIFDIKNNCSDLVVPLYLSELKLQPLYNSPEEENKISFLFPEDLEDINLEPGDEVNFSVTASIQTPVIIPEDYSYGIKVSFPVGVFGKEVFRQIFSHNLSAYNLCGPYITLKPKLGIQDYLLKADPTMSINKEEETFCQFREDSTFRILVELGYKWVAEKRSNKASETKVTWDTITITRPIDNIKPTFYFIVYDGPIEVASTSKRIMLANTADLSNNCPIKIDSSCNSNSCYDYLVAHLYKKCNDKDWEPLYLALLKVLRKNGIYLSENCNIAICYKNSSSCPPQSNGIPNPCASSNSSTSDPLVRALDLNRFYSYESKGNESNFQPVPLGRIIGVGSFFVKNDTFDKELGDLYQLSYLIAEVATDKACSTTTGNVQTCNINSLTSNNLLSPTGNAGKKSIDYEFLKNHPADGTVYGLKLNWVVVPYLSTLPDREDNLVTFGDNYVYFKNAGNGGFDINIVFDIDNQGCKYPGVFYEANVVPESVATENGRILEVVLHLVGKCSNLNNSNQSPRYLTLVKKAVENNLYDDLIIAALKPKDVTKNLLDNSNDNEIYGVFLNGNYKNDYEILGWYACCNNSGSNCSSNDCVCKNNHCVSPTNNSNCTSQVIQNLSNQPTLNNNNTLIWAINWSSLGCS